MKLNLKYNATKIDEIEQAKQAPIEQCIGDASINGLSLFIQKGLVDDNGMWGVSRKVAIDTIDKYLEENEKEDLLLDIMEALVNAGFLSRELNVDNLREKQAKRLAQVKEKIEEI